MRSAWRSAKTLFVIVAFAFLVAGCTDDALAVRDELRTPTSSRAPDGLAWSIDWVRLDNKFSATSAVSVRPDQSMLIVDGGALYRSGGSPDTWATVAVGNDQPQCFTETAIGAAVVAIADDTTSRIYLEQSDGSFAELGLRVDGSVGCSLAWIDDRLWGTLDGTWLFSVNADGADLYRAQLDGPKTAGADGLTVLSALEPGAIYVEGVEPAASGDVGWRWRLDLAERPSTLEGLVSAGESVTVRAIGGRGSSLVLLGEPGVGFRTTTPLPSKAVLPLGDQARWTNSIWQSPRHFVDAGDRIYGFGAFTEMGASEIDSALWSLRTDAPVIEGWSEHRGVGPIIDDEPLLAHRVAGHGNRLLMSACQLNDVDCDQTGNSTLWLGTVTPPDYVSVSS